MHVKVLDKPFTVDVKRLYLPIILKEACPKCSEVHVQDLQDDYISYPVFNGEEHMYFYCSECEHEWQPKIKISLKVEEVK